MHTRIYNRRRMDEEIREEYSLSIDFRLQDRRCPEKVAWAENSARAPSPMMTL